MTHRSRSVRIAAKIGQNIGGRGLEGAYLGTGKGSGGHGQPFTTVRTGLEPAKDVKENSRVPIAVFTRSDLAR